MPVTDDLDAAIAGLQSMIADPWDKRTWEGAASKLGNGVAAIRTLRTQLAEVRAELAFVTENRNKWQDAATRRWFRAEEANAHADRAGAERAAQIEVKPLEWKSTIDGAGHDHGITFADCPVFEKRFWAETSDKQPMIEAKRAARIRSALIVRPSLAQTGKGELNEACVLFKK